MNTHKIIKIEASKLIEQQAVHIFGKSYDKLSFIEKRKILANVPGQFLIVSESEAMALAKAYPGYDIKTESAEIAKILNPKNKWASDGRYLITDEVIAKKIKDDFWKKYKEISRKDVQKKGVSYSDAKKITEQDVKNLQEIESPTLAVEQIIESGKKNARKLLEFIGIMTSDTGDPIAIYSDGAKHYTFQSRFIKFIKKHFSNAMFRGEAPDKPMAIYEDDGCYEKFKGILLPREVDEKIDLPLTLKERG